MRTSTPQKGKNQPFMGSEAGKVQLILIVLGLLLLGAFFSLTITPDLLEVDPNAHSINTFSTGKASSLSKKVLGWLPHDIALKADATIDQEPDWTVEFWSPIDVELENITDPMITMCKLNFREYTKNPHLYPMFKEVEAMSLCQGHNRRKEKLSKLMAELKAKEGTPAGRIVPPAGFVFHESRVGSTLVANTLASTPYAMVFSESPPPASVLLHCQLCSRKQQVQLFRDVVTLMGNSPIHNYLFFKLQSITSTRMEIALEAFPDTPFAFVYRNSVQTMMSHMDPAKGSFNSPCLRSKRAPPSEVAKVLESIPGKPNEAWCAAHLGMLCKSALNAYNKYGVTHDDSGHIKQRGMLINYESLPGIVPRALLPLFNIDPDEAWLRKMDSESKVYSKGKGVTTVFKSDSQDKEKRATDAINHYAKLILDPSYDAMLEIGLNSLHAISPESYHTLAAAAPGGSISDGHLVNWKLLKVVPPYSSLPHAQRLSKKSDEERKRAEEAAVSEAKLAAASQAGGAAAEGDTLSSKEKAPLALNLRGSTENMADHSHFKARNEFKAWSPFSNTHTSQSVSPAGACESLVGKGVTLTYPQTFSAIDVINNWNPDDTDIPGKHYDTLCHFDFQNEAQKKLAFEYRDAEVPFVVYNVPEIDAVVKKWSDLDYLHKKLGSKNYRTEKSDSNHFMYWNAGKQNNRYKDWKEPTKIIKSTFEDFIEVAIKGQNVTLEERKHEYFRVSSDAGNPWVTEELPFFAAEPSLFIKEPAEIRGIHCRFGMRSVTAETHFDGSRNFAVQLGGMRRWLLFHPKECENLYLLPPSHPSGRHTSIDLSAPTSENVAKFPKFSQLMTNEVIMQPGDALFIPTHWFHHIISLNLNYQCNCRSGNDYMPWFEELKKCGFA